MKDKAQVALADLRSANATINLPTDVATFTRLHKNLFLRGMVRRYNGGREFAPNAAGTAWDISPSIKKDPTIFYCDNVLGTSVPYETLIPTPNTRLKTAAAGPATATSIPFTSAMFIL
jgi:soluble lytic murein transglycosylase-like protein